jgi:hypothetical protein
MGDVLALEVILDLRLEPEVGGQWLLWTIVAVIVTHID